VIVVISDWKGSVRGGGQGTCHRLISNSRTKKAPASRPAPVKPFHLVVLGYSPFLAAWSPSLMASCSLTYLPCLVFP
jgi:hypothetical protein